jgi:predicted acetyltransferase
VITYKKADLENIPDLINLRIEFLKEAQNFSSINNDKELFNSLEKYFSEKIKNNEFISWLAYKNNVIIATSGICFYTLAPSFKNITGKTAYIMNMYTKPEYRKQGIASNLFIKMIDEAKNLGIKKLVLHATDEGKKIYSKHGFKDENSAMMLTLI